MVTGNVRRRNVRRRWLASKVKDERIRNAFVFGGKRIGVSAGQMKEKMGSARRKNI